MCRIEINASYIASLDPDRWGYEGGSIVCPRGTRCGGDCCFADENFTTFELMQGIPGKLPTQTEKFHARQEARDNKIWGSKLAGKQSSKQTIDRK